jgi:hypothetical protein
MENTQLLEAKLDNLNKGAHWFKVIGIVLTVFGGLMILAGGLKLLPLLGPRAGEVGPVLADALSTASAAVGYWIMAWLAWRAGDAFEAISALIRELGEIV